MKIAFVNNQHQLGGAETVVRQLRAGLARAGQVSNLYVADGKDYPHEVTPLYPRALSRLYHTRLQGWVDKVFPRQRWTDWAFRRLAHGDHELVHVHNFHGRYATVESLAYVARHKPVVWTFHALWGVTGGCDHPRDCQRYLQSCGTCPQLGRWPLGPLDDTAMQLERKIAALAGLALDIIAPSRWLANIVERSRVGRSWRVHHIPNAAEPAPETAATLDARECRGGEQPTILIINRDFADEQKGFPIVEEALAKVTAAGRGGARARLLLVGRNSDWAAARLAGWPAEAFGYIADPAKIAALNARADIFLFASPAENFPCVVLEAMAAGGCVVATPSGGVVEQIGDGVSGLLARTISGPALAESLERALADSNLRRRIGIAAQERARSEYSERKFLARHQAVYAQARENWHPSA